MGEENTAIKPRRGPKPLTPEQARAYGRLGGLKRQEMRRRRKSLSDALETLMGAELMFGGEEMKEAMTQAGLKELSNADGVGYAVLAKACQGDTNAMRIVRDMCGLTAEPPTEKAAEGGLPELSALSDEELRRMVAAGEA